MKFEVDLTKDDLASFHEFVAKKIDIRKKISGKKMIIPYLIWFFLAVFLLEMYSVYFESGIFDYSHLNKAILAFVMWFALVNIWCRLYVKLSIEDVVSNSDESLGIWEYSIDKDGITTSNGRSSVQVTWGCVKRIEKTNKHLFVFTGYTQAFILPLEQITQDIELGINKNVAIPVSNAS